MKDTICLCPPDRISWVNVYEHPYRYGLLHYSRKGCDTFRDRSRRLLYRIRIIPKVK